MTSVVRAGKREKKRETVKLREKERREGERERNGTRKRERDDLAAGVTGASPPSSSYRAPEFRSHAPGPRAKNRDGAPLS